MRCLRSSPVTPSSNSYLLCVYCIIIIYFFLVRVPRLRRNESECLSTVTNRRLRRKMRKRIVLAATVIVLVYYYTRRLSKYQQSTRWHRLRTMIRISLERIRPIVRLLLAMSRTERTVYAPTLSFIQAARGKALPSSSSSSSSSKKLILYQWPLSYFSGKIRAFLRYQRVEFEQVRRGVRA